MNYHDFIRSQLDENLCAVCKRPADEHVCEVCREPNPQDKVRIIYGNMLICEPCEIKEKQVEAVHMSEENQQKRVNELIQKSRDIDERVKLNTDFFNAATTPLMELKAAIDADSAISQDQKQFAYTNECMKRFLHYKEVLVPQDMEVLNKHQNEMRAFQLEVQRNAVHLREEFREKYKQLDISYQPTKPKSIKPKAEKIAKKRFSMDEVSKYAREYSVPLAGIQMLLTMNKNLTPEEAAKKLRQGQDLVDRK